MVILFAHAKLHAFDTLGFTASSVTSPVAETPFYNFKINEHATMPLARSGCAVGIAEGKLVVAGGTYWRNSQKYWSDRVDYFDPVTNRWEAGTALPTPCADTACVANDGALYVLGGGTAGSAEASVKSFRHGQWKPENEMTLPAPRRAPSAVVTGGVFYVLGGFERADLASFQSTLWAAKPGDRWETRAPLPGPPRFNPAIAVVSGRILVAGGATLEAGNVRNLDEIMAYDPSTNQWSLLGQLPTANRAACGLADGAHFLIIGGFTSTFESNVLSVDSSTGLVSLVGCLPHGLADARFLRIGTRIIGLTGECGPKVRAPWLLEAVVVPNAAHRR